jgi:glucokinase
MILAGDIGGTHTRLAIFDDHGQHAADQPDRTYPSREHAGLEEIVRRFVGETGVRPVAACFGVAGPVRDGRSVATNLPWVVDAADLGRVLGARTWVINDLEATAWGLGALAPSELAELAPGAPEASGNAAVIAAGTGLGEAGLYWDGERYHPFATEGGHASFGPGDELEIELLRWLEARHRGHVSWERVVSGPGLVSLYEFLRDTGRAEEPPSLAEAMRVGDPGAAITAAALNDRVPLAMQALDRFVVLYASKAADLALTLMARGGLYLGGGIAPRILPRLRDGRFLARFLDKGRMRPVLESMPVRVVLNDRAGLLGAGRCAAARAGGGPAIGA